MGPIMSQPIPITLADLKTEIVGVKGTVDDDLTIDFARKVFDLLVVNYEKAQLATTPKSDLIHCPVCDHVCGNIVDHARHVTLTCQYCGYNEKAQLAESDK